MALAVTSQAVDGTPIPQTQSENNHLRKVSSNFFIKVKKNEKEMKTYRYYIMTLALSLFVAGCSEDELTKGPGAKVGDEVKFGLSLPGLSTRTIYGEENDNKFPIYWVNGDLVKVASPQCLSGRNSAEYSISAGEKQNYATSMTKTGDAGVQWGDAATADFYSIYPSSASTKLEVSGTGVTTTLHVDATQFASTKDNGTSYYAQPAEMGNVVMYAKTTGVTSGQTVELHYIPFSTVIEFEITAPDAYSGNQKSEITIQSLTLTALTGTTIAGDFAFNFDGPSITPPEKGGSNSITLHFLDNNHYKTVLSTTKTTLKAKMCLMPISGNLAGWKIEVNTSAGTFSKTLTESDKDGKKTDLIAGQVHKIKLPTLSYASQEWVYSLDKWIPTLPDYTNIYLSELSLPGAWYAGSDEAYQATSSITDLWNAGVRAFAVECRTDSKWVASGLFSGHWTPEYVCISGTGRNTGVGDAYDRGKNITTVLDNIKTALASHQDEYAVLVLSYADGGSGGHRAEDHAYFLQGVANALSGYTDIVYDKEITANTTINDVMGKLIVKVNVDSNITKGDYTGMNALLSYNPFLSQMTGANFSRPYYSDLHWSGWEDSYKSYNLVADLTGISDEEVRSKFLWVFSSANRTQADTGTNTTIPTYAQRQAAFTAMMDYSKQIYDASTHNVWFYFNCGGTQATSSTSGSPSPTDFAKGMNLWLKNTINAKTDPSPLGIVMFNQCTGDNATYYGKDIINAIVEMNSKFYLKHAGANTNNTGGSTEQTVAVKSLSENHDSAIKDSGTNAISWEE